MIYFGREFCLQLQVAQLVPVALQVRQHPRNDQFKHYTVTYQWTCLSICSKLYLIKHDSQDMLQNIYFFK